MLTGFSVTFLTETLLAVSVALLPIIFSFTMMEPSVLLGIFKDSELVLYPLAHLYLKDISSRSTVDSFLRQHGFGIVISGFLNYVLAHLLGVT